MSERWLPVIGFEAFYEVSDHGRVRSLDRVVAGGCRPFLKRGHILKLKTKKNGYQFVCLCVNNVRKYKHVQRLVCEAFIGPPPFENAEADHDNKIRADNRLTNLSWTTITKNRAHRDICKGEAHSYAVLSERSVIEIRTSNESCRTLAKRYGIGAAHVRRVKARKVWRHVA